ncbi:hypothetical protein P879_03362 [Paragonimus westermani]|uniref:Uncharacterized protein n=1 Tax=Paragonimus westermani TaxID=34504 RepID=A0A8T0DGX1_9TREM|nr:hypothetical protein P879_03362 [Paragonimus westermani]
MESLETFKLSLTPSLVTFSIHTVNYNLPQLATAVESESETNRVWTADLWRLVWRFCAVVNPAPTQTVQKSFWNVPECSPSSHWVVQSSQIVVTKLLSDCLSERHHDVLHSDLMIPLWNRMEQADLVNRDGLPSSKSATQSETEFRHHTPNYMYRLHARHMRDWQDFSQYEESHMKHPLYSSGQSDPLTTFSSASGDRLGTVTAIRHHKHTGLRSESLLTKEIVQVTSISSAILGTSFSRTSKGVFDSAYFEIIVT